eukprot:270827_1
MCTFYNTLLKAIFLINAMQFICLQSQVNYYISKEGIDDSNCGSRLSSRGTLYHVSTLINNISYVNFFIVTVSVIDGQNEAQISEHINNPTIYHPCIPMPLLILHGYHLNFVFDTTNIKTMTDWFPEICATLNKTQYINTHFFYIFRQFTNNYDVQIDSEMFTNLIINDYTFDANSLLAILWSNSLVGSDCYECIFSNLQIVDIPQRMGIAMWHSERNRMSESTFQNITLNGLYNFVMSGEILYTNVHMENLHILENDFIQCNEGRIRTSYFNDIYINIEKSLFQVAGNYYSMTYFSMTDSQLFNMNKGCILSILGTNGCGNSALVQSNVITTNQIRSTSNSLFRFRSFDEVEFKQNNITYYYNLYENCIVQDVYSNELATIISVNCSNSQRFSEFYVGSEWHMNYITFSIIYVDNAANSISLDEYREFIAAQYNFTLNDIYNQDVIIQFEFDEQVYTNDIGYIDRGDIIYSLEGKRA